MNPLQHLDLLQRYDRALNLRAGVAAAVRPGCRVLDAGCGLGLLSFWAAEAGAARVLGVDMEGIELASSLCRENGFAERVQFLEGDLWNLDLPAERNGFDVIAAMVYLNDPRRDERQAALVYRLRDRFLAAGGTMIPDRVCYTVRGCDSGSQDRVSQVKELQLRVSDLHGRYGFTFQALGAALLNGAWLPMFPPKGSDGRLRMADTRILTDTIAAMEVDYTADPEPPLEAVDITITAPGTLNTLVWTQELWFRKSLLFANESLSWIANPLHVNAGKHCRILLDDEWRSVNVATIA